MKQFVKWLLSALYGLVMIEVIIMISPFAFYWYSLYAPTLQSLHRWRATAWMEAFFLPHSVITTSPTLEFLRWQLAPIASAWGFWPLFCSASRCIPPNWCAGRWRSRGCTRASGTLFT